MSKLTVLIALVLCCWNLQPVWAQNSLQSAADQAARNQLVGVLVNDLIQLIPGEFKEDSDEQRKLMAIAQAYVSRDQKTVESLLSELEKSLPNCPPAPLMLAAMAFATNNPSGGAILLERGAVANPEHPGFAMAFARVALLQNRFFDSLALTEKALRTNEASSLDATAKTHYERACIELMTVVELRRNEMDRAEAYARRWEKLAPRDDKMLLASAEIRFKQQKLQSAVEFLNRRSAEKQSDIPTEVVIGKWYQSAGDWDSYAKWIGDAFAKRADNKLSQIEYSAVLLRKEDFKQAATVIANYEKTFGISLDSKLVRGRMAFSQQDYKTAGLLFGELFQSQPNSFEHAYLNILAMLENPDNEIKKKAIPLAQRAYQLFPNNQLAIAVLGWTLFKTGSVEPAAEFLQKAYTTGVALPDTSYFLANYMKSQGRNLQALRILEPAVATREIFLFRSRAQDLIDQINLEDNLPSPKSDN